MKYKVLGLTACVGALSLSVLFTCIADDQTKRYHQHLEAQEKAVCSHGDESFCTHLPLLLIDTDGKDIPGAIASDKLNSTVKYTKTEAGEKNLTCQISVIDHESTNNHPEDPPDIQSLAQIRIRGNSSRHFDKHSYALELFTEDGSSNKQPVMGMDSHSKWVLHGPFLDKTLLRNYIWYNISGEIMDYAPNVRFCEVILNGEYQGIYVMTETITAGDEGARLNLKVNKKKNSFSGYLLRLDRGSENSEKDIRPFSLYSYRMFDGQMNIEFPGSANLTPQIINGITQDFSDFERMLYSYDYDHKKYGYTRCIDVDSFVDYFLINEFTCNYDATTYSTYIYKDLDNKYRMCVWDFNNSCDNYKETDMDTRNFALHSGIWYYMLMMDEDFTDRIIDRYRYLRTTYLSEEYLENYINEVITYLGDAIERNYEKWGYVFEESSDLLIPKDRNPHSYADAVSQLKSFLKIRGRFMDENIESLRQYSAESKVKTYNEYSR